MAGGAALVSVDALGAVPVAEGAALGAGDLAALPESGDADEPHAELASASAKTSEVRPSAFNTRPSYSILSARQPVGAQHDHLREPGSTAGAGSCSRITNCTRRLRALFAGVTFGTSGLLWP